jgi:hypothetical protein
MTQITITNAGGTLNCDAVAWEEGQICDPAIREIPLRSQGEYLDTGTWTLKNRIIRIAVRVTDAEKTTLFNILVASANVTITALAATSGYEWVYTAWLRKQPSEYEYSKDGSGNEREWIVKLEFVASTFLYQATP